MIHSSETSCHRSARRLVTRRIIPDIALLLAGQHDTQHDTQQQQQQPPDTPLLYCNVRLTGADTELSVKRTWGGGTFGLAALPNKTTVSPDRTDCTLAKPVLGKTIGGLAVTGGAVVVVGVVAVVGGAAGVVMVVTVVRRR
jgi:hypothetical protein